MLGIELDEQLTVEFVRQRHRALSTVFHPDKPGGSLKRMQRINEARDELLDLLAKGA